MTPDRVGILVLAAGGSTRMGRPKQLLRIDGQTLVRRATDTALALGGPVVVVTGAHTEPVSAEVRDLPVQVIENTDWPLGMGSSLRLGVRALLECHPELDALIVTLCDQVNVSSATLKRLLDAHRETGRELCAASFDDTVGPPALLSRSYFGELLQIPDSHGAKQVLMRHPHDLARVPCPEAAQDLDRWEDYERLTGQ